jgi:ABC-type nitrate/sulfonate/bicarbonate transport system substrate-binding protein
MKQIWTARASFATMTLVTLILLFLLEKAIVLHMSRKEQPRHLALFLNWVPESSFAGPLLAKSLGLWEAQGLDVDVVPGGSDRDPIELVIKNAGSFGIAGADRVLSAISRGIRIVAVEVDFQRSPVGWMVRALSDIKRPKDFENHRVATKHDESELIYLALLEKEKVNRRLIREFPAEFSPQPFLDNEVDAWPVYISEEPHVAEAHNIAYRLIKPSDYGIDLYGNVLFTSVNSLESDEKIACRFVRGYLEGWRQAIKDPESAVKLLSKAVPETEKDTATLRKTLKSTFELLSEQTGLPPEPAEVGKMTTAGWKRTSDFLISSKHLPSNFDVDSAFDQRCLDSVAKK